MQPKLWTHHTRATAQGERTLASRLKEEGLPRETAEVFAASRISTSDLEHVVRATAKRFVMDMPGYDYGYFREHFGYYPLNKDSGTAAHKSALPQPGGTQPYPSKEYVAHVFGDVLLDIVQRNMKATNTKGLSWGQILSRSKTLYGTDAQGHSIDEHGQLAKAFGDTLAWFEFEGVPRTGEEQRSVFNALAQQAAVMKVNFGHFKAISVEKPANTSYGTPVSKLSNKVIQDKLEVLAGAPSIRSSGSYTKEPLNKLSHDVALTALMNIIHHRKPSAGHLPGMLEKHVVVAATPQAEKAVEAMYERAKELLIQWRNVRNLDAKHRLSLDKQIKGFIDTFPEELELAMNPPPPQPKKFFSFGSKNKPQAPIRFASPEKEPAVLYEDGDTPHTLLANPPASVLRPSALFDQATRLASQISFLTHAQHAQPYLSGETPAAKPAASVNIQAFVATRIIGGHEVEQEVTSVRCAARKDHALRGAYCMAAGLKPMLQRQAQASGDDRMLQFAENILRDAKHYAPGKGGAEKF